MDSFTSGDMHLAKVSRNADRNSFLAVLLLLWFYPIPEIKADCFVYPCSGCKTSGATSFTYCATRYRTTFDGGDCTWGAAHGCPGIYKQVAFTMNLNCSVTCCSGYSAQSNECRDIDECSVGNPCDHNCANTEGSYTCSCNTGYQLSGLTNCIDTDECASNTDGCDVNSECENTAGSFRCNCNNGYQAELSTTSSTTSCIDVDECASSDTNQCDHMCHNNVGSYTCRCNTGYMLSGSHNCVDVDECTSTTFPHDCQHSCVNNVGSFSCTCLTGYELSGRTQCNDIDECSVGKPCDHSCANAAGSYTCSCNTGYQLSGLTSCIDIDECLESPFPCDQNCHNNVGNFTCTCRPGYNLIQGSICQDIDECATNNGGCSHFCSNQVGSYQCSCDTGYVLATDRHMCEEFNPLDPPSVQPADPGFIQSITQYLVGGGCGAELCSCARSMFQALQNQSLGTTNGDYELIMDSVYYLGLEIKNFVFATPLSSFMGDFATQTPFLTTKTNAALVQVSSATSKLPMSGQLYTDLVDHFGGALKGYTVYSITGWPSGCSSSGMCRIMYDLLGPDAIFFIFAHLEPTAVPGVFDRIYIEAGLKNFKLGSLSMSYASLFMDYSTGDKPDDKSSYTFGIQAAIILPVEPVITLHGSIAVTLSKNVRITVEFAMQGCWVGAFGIEFLDICDLFLAATMTVGNPFPTGGAFGMWIKLGHPDCFRYDAQGIARIDSENPTSDDNYVYVNVRSPVTLQSFFDFLCSGVMLPSFLGEHGFPEGFLYTYAKDSAVIPQLALFIPKGNVFNGTLSWYGVKVKAYLYVDLPDVVEAKAELYPMNLAGGLIKLYRSRSETQRGPFLSVVMRTAPLQQFTAEASGYVSLLGIEAEVIFYFNQFGFELYVHGNIFNVLEANMRIYASVGSVYNAEFGIEAKLTQSLFKAIEDGVVAFLRGAADAAEAAISAPLEAVRWAQRAFDTLNEQFLKAQSAVAGARRSVANVRDKIGNVRHQLDHYICRYRSCGKVCIPLLCGCGCAVRIWGACVIPCLRWDNCCFRIPNPICLLYNIACFVIRIPVELALLALQGVLTFFELALYFAELALRAVQLLVEVAQLALEFAINTLEVIKQLFKFALQALEAITRFLLTGLIDIRAMGFDVKLGLLSHGHVRAWVDVSFLRASPERLTITLPIFSQLALVADFAERCIPGIGRKKRAIRSLDKVKWLANNFTKTGSIYPRLSTR